MDSRAASRAPVITGLVFLLIGLVLAGGGLWLASLGGSWFYLLAGLGFIATAVLLWMRRPAALAVYAALLLATLAWSLWEAGLDWWPLATRLGLLFLLALWLQLPWVRRGLVDRRSDVGAPGARPARAGKDWIPLAAVAGLVLLVSAFSWTRDPSRIDRRLPAPAAAASSPSADGVPPGEWHAYGRTGYGQRYSPLAQITPANLDQLEVAWTYRTGDVRGLPGDPEETTFEVTPLKIDNRLFLCTPHQSVIAVDATTGEEIWRLDPRIQDDLALQHLTCRGLSWYPGTPSPGAGNTGDAVTPSADSRTPSGAPIAAAGLPIGICTARLFMPTADGRLIAISPEDGRVCADFGDGTGQVDLWRNMPEVNPGSYYSTSPPVVAGGLVIIGGTVLDNVTTTEPSGVIRAFDARTGELVWNWDPGNPGDTAPIGPGETYSVSTPNSWSISSVDEALGLVYIPMGNQPPDQWGGDRDPEGARYSSSVVALDIATGQLRWVFQTVHHDLWDYDVPAQPSLIDLEIGGETVPALVQPTKQGEIFVLDRRTGEPVLPVEET